MNRSIARLCAILTLTASLGLLAACSTPAPEPSPTPTNDAGAPSPTPTPEVTESTAPVASDPTCETIIPAETVADFEGLGWTVQADVFRAGSIELPAGVQCTWGDFSVANDHVQIFGWAPITSSEAVDAKTELIAAGWRQEDGELGVYVTESADTAIATDEEGYGMTYLFGDGWVTLADTKQGLLLISWPPA